MGSLALTLLSPASSSWLRRDSVVWATRLQDLSVDDEMAAPCRPCTEDKLHQLRSSGAHESAEAEDLDRPEDGHGRRRLVEVRLDPVADALPRGPQGDRQPRQVQEKGRRGRGDEDGYDFRLV